MTLRTRLLILCSAAAGVYAVAAHYQPTVVVGSSMAPTLRSGRVVLVDRTYYRRHTPRRGEVIVFRHEGDTYIKRVYRAPGETATFICRDGCRIVPIRESFARQVERLYQTSRTSLEIWRETIPPNAVFVMGDNQAVSVDSRTLGPIPINAILGRVHISADSSLLNLMEFVPRSNALARQVDQQPAVPAKRRPAAAQTPQQAAPQENLARRLEHGPSAVTTIPARG